jgi:hypothetical protein
MTAEEKLDLAIQALKDVENPAAMMMRNRLPGTTLDVRQVTGLLQNPELYTGIARTALTKLGIEVD